MRNTWRTVPLGKVVTFKGGGTPSKKNPAYWGGDIPWISPKDMKSIHIAPSIDTITEQGISNSSASIIPKDSLLLVVRSGILSRTIPVSIAATELTINQDLKALIPSRNILPSFLYYYLKCCERHLLERVTRSATVHRLQSEVLKSLPVPLPSLDEQKRIVAILDEAFAGIATAIANTEKNLANARELFDSFLTGVFKRNKSSSKNRKLESVCNKITVGHVGSMKSKYKATGIPMLRSQNIRPFKVDLEKAVFIDEDFHAELKKSALQPGDLAIVRTGYPGTAAVIPESLPTANCSDLVIVRPGKEVKSEFLALFFNSSFGKAAVGAVLVGAAQKHFNITAAKNSLIPIPSIKEQEKVISECQRVREETENLKKRNRIKLELFAELKQSLLQKAFSGELTAEAAKEAAA